MTSPNEDVLVQAVPASPGRGGDQVVEWVPDPARDLSALASFDCQQVGACAVVGAAGEIDVSTAAAFRTALLSGADRSPCVVVDLSNVTFLDCAGLSALVTAVKHLRASGGRLHLVGVAGAVDRLISLTGLNQVVAIEASLEDAVSSMPSAS